MTTRTLAAVLLALLGSARAAAQEEAPEPVLPAPGTMSLSFRHDAGSSAIAIGRMVGSRTRVDLGVGFGTRRERSEDGAEERTDVDGSADLRLAVRRYAAPQSRIAPFLLAAASGFHYRQNTDADLPDGRSYDASVRGLGIGLEAGGGVEWFPAARAGISGEAGVGARANRLRIRSDGASGPGTAHRTSLSLRTFTSALALTLYF